MTGTVLAADGRPHHEAGASEAQELAAVLATGAAYLRLLEAAGLAVGQARDAIGFTLVADADPLMTVAKFRALRRLWACLEQACGLEPTPIRLHAETAWRMLTRRDPWTNLVRTSFATIGAILGGADSLTVLPFTTALGLPDATARRVARNTTLVLIEEAGLGHVADPAAGSGAFEAVTDGLCEGAWSLFQDIERQGGMGAALASGWWQDRLCEGRAAQAGQPAIIGTTLFAGPEVFAPSVLPVAPSRPAEPVWGSDAVRFPALPSYRDAEPFEDLEAA